MLPPIATKILDNQIDRYANCTKITTNMYTFNTVTLNVVNMHDLLLYNQAMAKKHAGENATANVLFKQCLLMDNETKTNNVGKKYNVYINLALLSSDYDDIVSYYEKAMHLCPDRSESYLYFGIYCNQHRNFEKSYELLTIAKNMSYNAVKDKYPDVKETEYGVYVFDELSVSCYWLKKYDEGLHYLTQIINMPYFKNHETRLKQNLDFFTTISLTTC